MLLSFTTPHKFFYPHPFLLVSFILVGLHQPSFLSFQMEHNEFNDLLWIDLTFRNRRAMNRSLHLSFRNEKDLQLKSTCLP